MKTKSFLVILFGALICLWIMDSFVIQPLFNSDSNLAYAKKKEADPVDNGKHLGIGGKSDNFVAIPEPSTLILLGTGLTSIGVYLYSKHKGDKK